MKKLVLRIGVLEIKYERNWSFENYLKIGVFFFFLEVKYLLFHVRDGNGNFFLGPLFVNIIGLGYPTPPALIIYIIK